MAANFTAQNADPITISLFEWTSPAYHKWQFFLATLFVGALCATLFFIVELIVLETRVIRLRRANQKLERSLVALTNQSTHATSVTAEPALKAAPRHDDV